MNKKITPKKLNDVEKYWVERNGKEGLMPVKSLDFYKPKYRKICTALYNTIKSNDIAYCNWGRNIFCRELAEEIMDLIEYDLKKEILRFYKIKI